MPLVEIRNLNKSYGRFNAVQDLTLDVEQGAIFGFIGPNGAGKTTTMRILSTLLDPTSGEAWVGGDSVTASPDKVRSRIGYMPDFFGVYDNMRVAEYLDFFGAAYNVPAEGRDQIIGDLLTLVDLNTKRDNYVDELSRGMKQRLGLARTLVHDPDLLILDEPASGLDPRARIEMRELLKELRQLGKTIMISSHILTELAELCTHIGIIERGRLLVAGEVKEILRRLQPSRTIQIRVLGRSGPAMQILTQMPGVQKVDWLPPTSGPPLRQPGVQGPTMPLDPNAPPPYPPPPEAQYPPAPVPVVTQPQNTIPDGPGILRVRVAGDENLLSAILIHLVRNEVPVYSFSEEASDLEDIFLRITRGLVQ